MSWGQNTRPLTEVFYLRGTAPASPLVEVSRCPADGFARAVTFPAPPPVLDGDASDFPKKVFDLYVEDLKAKRFFGDVSIMSPRLLLNFIRKQYFGANAETRNRDLARIADLAGNIVSANGESSLEDCLKVLSPLDYIERLVKLQQAELKTRDHRGANGAQASASLTLPLLMPNIGLALARAGCLGIKMNERTWFLGHFVRTKGSNALPPARSAPFLS